MTCKRFSAIATLSLLPLWSHAANDVGRQVYESVCIACHAQENIMVSAPKFGDAAEWQRRLARSEKGIDTLTDHAVNGFAAMPPKGGHSELTRDQIRQAIRFMASSRDSR